MKKTLFRVVLLASLFLVSHSLAGENSAAILFPLEKDSYWVYKGKIKWTPKGENQKVRSEIITWRMTVREILESQRYKVAVVTGFPNDVAWYEEGMVPKYSLLVQTGNNVYWNGYETREDALKAAKNIIANDSDSVENLRCLIEFPLFEGKKYDITDKSREDTMYAWFVEQIDKAGLTVKGYKGSKSSNRFRIVYKTLPDHIIMEFVEGLGITRYVYEHHGTVASEDLHLVEYGRESAPDFRQDRMR